MMTQCIHTILICRLIEVKSMADRTILMRERLREGLQKEGVLINLLFTSLLTCTLCTGSKLDWSHITGQIGMFCFSGLNEQQVRNTCKHLLCKPISL